MDLFHLSLQLGLLYLISLSLQGSHISDRKGNCAVTFIYKNYTVLPTLATLLAHVSLHLRRKCILNSSEYLIWFLVHCTINALATNI
ncbi:hypothetical protein FKM82_011431 [Ascaphus truei]